MTVKSSAIIHQAPDKEPSPVAEMERISFTVPPVGCWLDWEFPCLCGLFLHSQQLYVQMHFPFLMFALLYIYRNIYDVKDNHNIKSVLHQQNFQHVLQWFQHHKLSVLLMEIKQFSCLIFQKPLSRNAYTWFYHCWKPKHYLACIYYTPAFKLRSSYPWSFSKITKLLGFYLEWNHYFLLVVIVIQFLKSRILCT